MIQISPLPRIETFHAFFETINILSYFMVRVSKKFQSSRFVRTKSLRRISTFQGDKICGDDVLPNAANCGKQQTIQNDCHPGPKRPCSTTVGIFIIYICLMEARRVAGPRFLKGACQRAYVDRV